MSDLRGYYDQPWFPGMGGGGTPPPTSDPQITTLAPATGVTAVPLDVTVNGTDFRVGAVVEVDGTDVPSTRVSATEMTVTAWTPGPAGTVQSTVRNTDAGESANAPFVITATVDDPGGEGEETGDGEGTPPEATAKRARKS